VVDGSVAPTGEFIFEDFNTTRVKDLQEIRSLWKIRLSARFDFN
jgi:hypothetical protein